jgi:hypothetical protein
MDSENDKCITNCYNDEKDDLIFVHPFLGLIVLDYQQNDSNYCFKNNYNNNKLFMWCDDQTSYNMDIKNIIKNPIHSNNYLKLFYDIENLDDLIKYLKINIQLLLKTKKRIVDFAYIVFKNNIKYEYDKWIEIIKLCYNNINHSDEKIIKSIDFVISKYDFDIKSYPFNFVSKIKKNIINN